MTSTLQIKKSKSIFRKKKKESEIYFPSVLNRTICVPINHIGFGLNDILLKIIDK